MPLFPFYFLISQITETLNEDNYQCLKTHLENDAFNKYGIDSGLGLKEFMEAAGLHIRNFTGIEGSQNIIYLPDKTSFNWKSADRIVRINCKKDAVRVIESKTELIHRDNVKGDPTRPFSFIVDSLSDLNDAIYALKTIPGNKAE